MEKVRKFLKYAWKDTIFFIGCTYDDFVYVWRKRPNVLIWSALLGVVLFFM